MSNNYLIFGGTGTVGNVLTKHYLNSGNNVTVFSRDEYKQFYMKKKYQEFVDNKQLRFIIGDIKQEIRINGNFDYVVQAAALKHVSSCAENPHEAIAINYYGNNNVIDYCLNSNIISAVYIATDKAVNPVNTYGMTKQLAEFAWLESNIKKDVFRCVRLGNIFGSRGSAVEYFLTIKDGVYPISDVDSQRYFVTNKEIIALIDQIFSGKAYSNVLYGSYKKAHITDIIRVINPNAKFKVVGLREGEKIKEDFDLGFKDNGFFTMQELRQMLEEYKKDA